MDAKQSVPSATYRWGVVTRQNGTWWFKTRKALYRWVADIYPRDDRVILQQYVALSYIRSKVRV